MKSHAWEQRKLSDGMTEYTDRVFIEDDQIYKQVTVKNTGEISLRGSQPGRNIGRKRQARVNLRDYPMTLIFTRQTVEQGGIGFAKNDVDGCIVTENMPTIAVDGKKFNQDFLVAFFKTYGFRKDVILSNIEGGTAQIAIHEDDILDSSSTFPSLKEQIKIGNFFRTLSQQITLHQRKWVEFFYPTYFRKFSFLNFWEFFNNRITNAWEQRKLGAIVQITMGQSPDGSTYSDTPADYILVQGNADLKNGWVCPRVWTTQKTKFATAGDLIMSVRAPAGSVGKTAYDVVLGRGVASLKGNEFIYQSLVKMDFDGYWKAESTGSTFESLSSDSISTAELYCPSEDEQHKIGIFLSRLDSLLTLHQRQSVSSDLLGASLHL